MSRSRLEWAEAAGVDRPRRVLQIPVLLGSLPVSSVPLSPVSLSPLRSGPLSAATSRSRSARPRLGGPALLFPGFLAGLPCLTRSRLWRVLRLLLTTAQLMEEEEGRAGCADGSENGFGACLQLPDNSARRASPAPLQLFFRAAEPSSLAWIRPLPFLVHWLWLFRSPWSAWQTKFGVALPLLALRSLLAATCDRLPLPPQPPFVAVAVAGSAGDIQGPPALSPSTKARSGCWLRAWLNRGLIITSPRTLNLTQTLSPWLGEEGKGLLAGWGPRHRPNLPLQAFQRQVPTPFAQHPIHVLFFFTPLLPTTPPLGQASPHCLISALALAG